MGPVRLSFTPQRILRFVLINAAFIAFLSLWNGQLHRESVQLAVAKSQQMLDMPAELAGYPSGYALDTAAATGRSIASCNWRSRAWTCPSAPRAFTCLTDLRATHQEGVRARRSGSESEICPGSMM